MSHHISDVIFWGGHPDRNYYVFVVLSILFGFFGADHFYLRSYATGTQKFLFNLVSLGMWHWWDIGQIVGSGEKIRKEGLSGPFDWMQGIGRGTFMPFSTEIKEDDAKYEAPKSYILYTFLAVFFGWLGMDKFYLGNWGQGLLKLISCFNLFLILFGWLWVLWDAAHAFFMTDSILRNGISPPIPYSLLFTEAISPEIFLSKKVVPEAPGAVSTGFVDWTRSNLGQPHKNGLSFGEVMTNVVNTANTAHTNIAHHAAKAAVVANAALNAAVNAANAPAAPHVNAPVAPHVNAAPPAAPQAAPPAAPQAAPAHPAQTGGGRSDGPGPVIAGALSALVLAGGLKAFYDVISKQYG